MLKYIFLLIFTLSFSFAMGQFNTISPQPKTKEVQDSIITEKKNNLEEKQENNPKPNFFKRLFTSEKSTLRKEIDSLKKVIEKNNSQKIDFKKIEDSIILNITKKLLNEHNISKEKKEVKKTSFSMPIEGDIEITSEYGMRFHPILKKFEIHNGIDIRAKNQFIYAVLNGVVSETGWDNNGGGLFIKVTHSNNFETSYLHLSEIYYKKGEEVKSGFVIGRSGNTGYSTAPHLHFAVKQNENYIDPILFLENLKNFERK